MFKVDESQACLDQAHKHWQSQQWQKTIQACAAALALNQESAIAHKLMGDALQKTNKAKEAIGYYQQAIAIQPDFVEVYANLGTLYAQQQQWQQAIREFIGIWSDVSNNCRRRQLQLRQLLILVSSLISIWSKGQFFSNRGIFKLL